MVNDTDTTTSGHPIPVAVARIEAELAHLADAEAWGLSTTDTRAVALSLSRTSARLTALEAKVLAHAEVTGAATETGASSTPAWLAHHTRATRPDAHRRTRLAASLSRHPLVAEAMGAGRVLGEQASVISTAVDALPDDPHVRETCARHLIGLAEHHDARELRILGRRVLDVIDPDLADAHEARLLERQEAEAAKATSFTMREDALGQVHGRFVLPTLEAVMLRKALMGIAAPKHRRATGDAYDHHKPTARRMGQAFAEYVSRYPAGRLPHAGGVPATVVVTMTLEALLGGLGAARIDTGEHISASRARHLSCEAGIIPAVLDGRSQVLDLGRRARFHNAAQRTALAIAQGHCQHLGCDVPAALCHTHHDIPWSRGGPTDVKHGRLLCPHHHTLAHTAPRLRT